jgi:hypothetical protein
MVVASALFVSTAVVFAASPANAAGTGSMVDNGDGSMTVTWTASAPDSVLINFYPSGATCPQFADGINVSFNIEGGTGVSAVPKLGASPALLSAGSSVRGGLPPASMQIPVGPRMACLYGRDGQNLAPLLQSLSITFAAVAPATTTTTTTTTTIAGGGSGDPVAPAFTG